jgi:hypothetical protein
MIKSKLMLLLIISVMSCFQLFNFDFVWGQSKSTASSSETMKDDIAEMPTITTLKSLIQSMQDLESQLKDLKGKLKAAETEEQKIKITADFNELAGSLDANKKGFERISKGIVRKNLQQTEFPNINCLFFSRTRTTSMVAAI